MELIKRSDLRFGKTGIFASLKSYILYSLLGVKSINKLYRVAFSAAPKPYCQALIDEIGVKYIISESYIKSVPASGGAIMVSNHPTGALDGVMLIDALSRIRPDVKFMGNFLLQRIEPLKQYFIDVDPFDNSSRSNVTGMRRSMEHVAAGGLLVIFPAGEVSTWQKGFAPVKDKEWSKSVIKFIRKAGVPVIPAAIIAHNSTLFHLLGKIHPTLRTAMLPRELVNKKGKEVVIRVGSPLTIRMAAQLPDLDHYSRFLRANVEYMLPLLSNSKTKRAAKVVVPQGDIIATSGTTELIEAELLKIAPQYKLFEQTQFEVYCAPASQIPEMLHEIGRQREIAFRQVGEGTKKEIDTDHFDSYYHQLFIWDKVGKRLVGAYRMGMGAYIMEKYGIEGFYTNTLFKMSAPLAEVLKASIELGRSFIVKEYQRKPTSLLLLWKGIFAVSKKYSEYSYFIGPVTISGEYKSASKLLIAAFLQQNHADTVNSKYICPLTGIDLKERIDESLIEGIDSLALIEKLVTDIEGSGKGIPVLIRRYLQMGSKALAFNIDHDFSDGLDILIMVNMSDFPEQTMKMLSK